MIEAGAWWGEDDLDAAQHEGSWHCGITIVVGSRCTTLTAATANRRLQERDRLYQSALPLVLVEGASVSGSCLAGNCRRVAFKNSLMRTVPSFRAPGSMTRGTGRV